MQETPSGREHARPLRRSPRSSLPRPTGSSTSLPLSSEAIPSLLGRRFRGQGEAVCAHQHRRVDPARRLHGSRGLRGLAETSVEPAEPRRAVPSGGRQGGEEWICQVHRRSCVYDSIGLFWELRSRINFLSLLFAELELR